MGKDEWVERFANEWEEKQSYTRRNSEAVAYEVYDDRKDENPESCVNEIIKRERRWMRVR